MPPSHATPAWAVAPFVAYLILIAVLPLLAGRWWERNRNKLLAALAISAPVALYLLGHDRGGTALLVETAREYAGFMALLAALFVISGGIYLRGSLLGTPAVNSAMLAAGAIGASFVGTTGASALLIRPLLRANAGRAHRRHLVVFFIFVVANGGGLLSPLGDPPLFLGFLRGVPFGWTLRLLPVWALSNGALVAIFYAIDRRLHRREPPLAVDGANEPFRLEGWRNVALLAGVVATMFLGAYARIVALLTLAALSSRLTPARIHEANRFSWAPLHEIAVVFVGVFVTMVPALAFLAERGAGLGITRPWQFFWASGALSSVLDNAPTYLTFASLASGVAAVGDLRALAADPSGAPLLAAVSCGSVLMGAVTYIGNGPNFMVKAIAEQHHVRMPSFFGYTLWSLAILMPVFALVALVFFR